MKLLSLLVLMMVFCGNAFAGTGYNCPTAKETSQYGSPEKLMRTVICVPDDKSRSQIQYGAKNDYKMHGFVIFYNEKEYPLCEPPFRFATYEEQEFYETSALEDKFLDDVCVPKKWWSK